jgi:hypothetical protein
MIRALGLVSGPIGPLVTIGLLPKPCSTVHIKLSGEFI